MKKMNLLLAALMMMGAAVFTSCEKQEPTELKSDSYAAQATIQGFVRYSALDNALKHKKPEEVKAGTTVLIRQEVEGEYVTYTTTTNKDGFFSVAIGCKPNSTVKATVKASIKEDTYAGTEDAKIISVDATFFGQEAVTVAEGSTAYVDLILTPVSSEEQAGLVFGIAL